MNEFEYRSPLSSISGVSLEKIEERKEGRRQKQIHRNQHCHKLATKKVLYTVIKGI